MSWKAWIASLAAGVATAVGLGAGMVTAQENPIVVGSILDETGPLNIYGAPMVDATKLAIDQINAAGGVLGRQLQLISYDAQSDNAKYT
jgi:urea transport system substrate-binding protein